MGIYRQRSSGNSRVRYVATVALLEGFLSNANSVGYGDHIDSRFSCRVCVLPVAICILPTRRQNLTGIDLLRNAAIERLPSKRHVHNVVGFRPVVAVRQSYTVNGNVNNHA